MIYIRFGHDNLRIFNQNEDAIIGKLQLLEGK